MLNVNFELDPKTYNKIRRTPEESEKGLTEPL